MKTIFKSLIIFCIFLPQFARAAAPKEVSLDVKRSSVKWTGKFTGKEVHASMKFKSGKFTIKNGSILKGNLITDMTSITSDSGLDDQFKSPLLLNTNKYPTAELKITEYSDVKSFAPRGLNAHVKGTLTFRGESRPVEGDFVLTPDKNGFHIVGTAKTLYGKMVDGEISYEVWAKK